MVELRWPRTFDFTANMGIAMKFNNKLYLTAALSIAAIYSPAGFATSVDDVPGAAEYLMAVPGASLEDAIKAMNPAVIQELEEVYECASKIRGFAGLETRHLPYRVVVKFKRDTRKKLRHCTKNRDFRPVGAARSLRDLEHIEEIAGHRLSSHGVEAEFTLNMRRNRVEVSVLKTDLKKASRLLRHHRGRSSRHNRGIRLIGVSGFGGIESADIRNAGNELDTEVGGLCTAGYSVFGAVQNPLHPQFGQVVNGATTANHCGRNLKYANNSGFFAGADTQTGLGPEENVCKHYVNPLNPADKGIQRRTDLQWYNEPGDSYDNLIEGHSDQVVGVFRKADLSSYVGRAVCLSGQNYGSIPERPASPGRLVEVQISQNCIRPKTPATVKQNAISNSPQITCGVYATPKTYSNGATVLRARILGATQNNQFVQGGDSGGPVFIPGGFSSVTDEFGNIIAQQSGNLAIGSTRSFSSQDLGYVQFTPIDDYDAQGLTVRTWITEQIGQGP